MTDTKGDKGETKKEGSRASSPSKTNRGGAKSKQSNHSNEKKNYYVGELERLKQNLQREQSQIQKPKRQKHTPYTFVPLNSYCSTNIVSQVVLKEPTQPHGYTNRQTAIGLCDPWVDHTMDHDFKKMDVNDSKATSPRDDESTKKNNDNKQKKGGKKKATTKREIQS